MQGVPKIPYFQTSRYRVETMVELAHAKPGEKAADLGSGDGRIVVAFAKKGTEMHGYEIDEDLRKLSKQTSEALHLTNVFIHNKDFWTEDLSQYDIICCYPMPTIMGRLERKLSEELKPGARILLNYFPFKHWKEKQIKDNIFLYIK
jgi:16S rRNA A1518/A1519 N6-dimethyltransferase RsmA/KsgA/DIM1 with predicted DNA glycosylase/AP lyase activity